MDHQDMRRCLDGQTACITFDRPLPYDAMSGSLLGRALKGVDVTSKKKTA